MADSPGNVTIRRARATDASTIADYNVAMARETEHLELDPPTVLAGVRRVIDEPSLGTYFVADIGGRVVGQLMITHEWSDWRNRDMWWIQSVYVAPAHRQRGVFRRLFEHAERAARQAGAGVVRLYVEKNNLAAQETYRRLGMTLTDYLVMEKVLDSTASSGD